MQHKSSRKVSHINELCLTLKDDTTEKNKHKNERQKANASAKSKEVQPTAQSQRFAPHLLLPHRTTTFTINF